MDVPSGSGLKREFKMPKPVPLPLSLFAPGASNENKSQSAKKCQPVKNKLELRPLKEVLSAAEYQFYLGSSKKPNHSETEVDNVARSKLVTEPKTRPSTITTIKLPRKELQTMSKKITKPKINYIQANKKIVKTIKETPKQIIRNERSDSTNSKNSDVAFAFYEKLFNGYQPSPLPKLCNSILQSTTNVESISDAREVIDSVKELVDSEELRHRRFITNITTLLDKLENAVSNKENNQIASSDVKNFVSIGSPLADLRQDVFHKNIAKKLVYDEDRVDDAKRQSLFPSRTQAVQQENHYRFVFRNNVYYWWTLPIINLYYFFNSI